MLNIFFLDPEGLGYDPRSAYKPVQDPYASGHGFGPHQGPFNPRSPWREVGRHPPYAAPPHSDHGIPGSGSPGPREPYRPSGYHQPTVEDYYGSQAPLNRRAPPRQQNMRDPVQSGKRRHQLGKFEMSGGLGSNAGGSGGSGSHDGDGSRSSGRSRHSARGSSRVG